MKKGKKLVFIYGDVDLVTGKTYEESVYGGMINTELYNIEGYVEKEDGLYVKYYDYNIFYLIGSSGDEYVLEDKNLSKPVLYKIDKNINPVILSEKERELIENIKNGKWVHFEKAYLVDNEDIDLDNEADKIVKKLMSNIDKIYGEE